MSLSIGIVGLPNSGKSTLFNGLVGSYQAKVADYPFTTIEPNIGTVIVLDARLQKISELEHLEKTIPATVKFIDIAGLVKGAHQGEGMGNEFLGHIRETTAILILLNGFSQNASPKEDLAILEEELKMADLLPKPRIYVLNVKESDLGRREELQKKYPGFIILSAKTEMELGELEEKERQDFMKAVGIEKPGLEKVIDGGFKALNLISFFTLKRTAPALVQSWPIKKGVAASSAAGEVHRDMMEKFIKAEVLGFEDLVNAGGWAKAKEKGLLRFEGKDYPVQDGDVIYFRFSS